MEHLAILSKNMRLLRKIVSGEKKVESRWYRFKRPPFGCINKGDLIYFKESGDPVSVRAKVQKVLIYDNLTPEKIRSILSEFRSMICVDMSHFEKVKDKRFCALMFLEDVEEIEPFRIDKSGYGMMNAWISVDSIDKLKAAENSKII